MDKKSRKFSGSSDSVLHFQLFHWIMLSVKYRLKSHVLDCAAKLESLESLQVFYGLFVSPRVIFGNSQSNNICPSGTKHNDTFSLYGSINKI